MPVRSLRHLLSLQSTLVAVFPFLLAGILGILWLRPQIDREIESRQLQFGKAIASQVESYLLTPLVNVEGMASLVVDDSFDWHDLQHMLDAHIAASVSLRAIYIASPDGTIKAVGLREDNEVRREDLIGLDFSGNHLFQRALRERRPVWSDTFLSVVGGGMSVAIAVPSADRVVIGEVDLDLVTEFLQRIAIDPEQLTLVIDERGQVIADQQGTHTAQQLNISNIPLVKRGLKTRIPVSEHFDFEGVSMVGSLTPIPSQNWHVLAALPEETAYRTIWTSFRIVTAGLMTAVLFGVAIALYLTRRLAIPCETLAAHARGIAAFKEAADWPTGKISEFNQLAADLQQMSDALRERERQISTLMSNLPGMAYRCRSDSQRKLMFVSEGSLELLGYSDQELTNDLCPGLNSIIDAEDLATVKERVDKALAQRKPYQATYRVRDAKRRTRWVLDHGRGVWDKEGHLLHIEGLVTDVTARRLAEEALKKALADAEEAKDKVELVLRSVADGLVFTDMRGRIVLMSASAEALLEVTQQEAWGLTLDNVVENMSVPGHIPEIQENGHGASLLELTFVNKKDGRKMEIQVSSNLVKNRDGEAAGVITLLRNISRERELDRMKSEFISTAAHELRTPLTVILGFAEILLEEKILADHQREYLSIIVDKSEVLQRLIDDLLDLGRVDSGRLVHIEKERCEVCELIRQAVAEARLTCNSHRFEMVLPEASVELYADRLRIAQVMENLLGNAVKFSPSGSLIEILCSIGDNWVQVAVADQGVGLTAAQKERIFEKFYRADSSSTSKQGLGLGMTIVKNIIDAHGGKIRVDSEPGRGTRIIFQLPVPGDAGDIPGNSHDSGNSIHLKEGS